MSREALFAALDGDLRHRMRRLDPEHGDDLAQEALLRLHRALEEEGTAIERVDAWVSTVARRVWIDHLRRRRPTEEVDDIPDLPAFPEATERVASWLPAFVEVLPEPYREAVRRVDLEGESQAALARDLGLSLSGARSRVQRGRAMLRDELLACCAVSWDEGEVIAIERRCGC